MFEIKLFKILYIIYLIISNDTKNKMEINENELLYI